MRHLLYLILFLAGPGILPVHPPGNSRALGQEPGKCHPCDLAGYPFRSDVNGDWELDVTDVVHVLTWLFLEGPEPACPGKDPTGSVDYFEFEDPAGCCVPCGDTNGDYEINISDPVGVIGWLYLGGGRPLCYSLRLPVCTASELVVDGEWVQASLDDETVQLVDVRSSGYATSRIPGALHVKANSLRATVDGVSGQVAALADVQGVLRAAGLRRDATVVVYGSSTSTTPARVVWALQYYGHEDVRLLDGGWSAWIAGSRPVETTPPGNPSPDYTIHGALPELRVTADWIVARLDDPGVVLVDARSSGEYASGNIPGALSVDWNRNVSGGAFRPRVDVSDLYEAINPGATVVTYCQSGSRASVAYVALRWIGFPDVRLYDGSWAEWGSRADLPKE